MSTARSPSLSWGGALASAKAAGGRAGRIEALVRALHREVRYTGVEFGEAAYVPRTPAETLKRKFGDCKDKSALLVAMLRASGIPAHVALLLTGSKPDSDPDLPGLGFFDHAIVYVPGTPSYWIDATDEYSSLGDLPRDDLARRALIIDPATTGLVSTPELSSAQRRTIEERRIILAPNGPARVVETTTVFGTNASWYRSDYATADRKEIEKQLTAYVKDNYAAEGLARFEHSAPNDFSKPFTLTLEAREARRGVTSPRTSEAAIPLQTLVSYLPDYFKTDPDEVKDQDKEAAEKAKRRTADFEMPSPYQLEWRYTIVPPIGYRLRQLPGGGTDRWAAAALEKEFTANPDGSVTARFSFDSGKRRMTVAEAGQLRSGVLALLKSKAVLVQFDQAGELMLEKGDIRGALAEFAGLAEADPKNAIHQARIARALLSAGAGEAARAAARRATEIDPQSMLAWQTLGLILQHDLVGRFRQKGFDHTGALAAYRKAAGIEPDKLENNADIAILPEHDPATGRRYTKTARLDEAITEYRKLGEKTKGTGLADNLPSALFWAGKFAELEELTRTDRTTSSRKALFISAIAAGRGAADAIAEARRLSGSDDERRQAMAMAGTLLMNARRYLEASALLVEAAKGVPNAARLINFANILQKTRRVEDLPMPAEQPATVAKRTLMAALGWPEPSYERLALLLSNVVPPAEEVQRRSFVAGARRTRSGADPNLGPEVIVDVAISGLQIATEGSDERGYRLHVQGVGFGGDKSQTLFVVKEDGAYRLLGLVEGASGFEDVARAAHLAAIEGRVEYARGLLDWFRDQVPVGGDDPLAVNPLARLWEKGSQAGKEEILVAAAAGFAGERANAGAVATLQAARSKARGDRLDAIETALARAANKHRKWEELAELAGGLAQRHPKSGAAFEMRSMALRHLNRIGEVRKFAQERLAAQPDNLEAIRALQVAAGIQHDVAELKRWTN